ncbi:hypothetical protein [Methylopila sp. M107]|uniref:hypothetical protein n=1 Tax=Methylopila sp. M107 TaxID=1101190 RepID=UPI00037375FE|nr:hypothetical protein [Methylopila sp. M107]
MIVHLTTRSRPRLRWDGGSCGWTAETSPPSIFDWRGLAIDLPDRDQGFHWRVEAADMTDPDPDALVTLVSGTRPTLTAAKIAAEAAAGV